MNVNWYCLQLEGSLLKYSKEQFKDVLFVKSIFYYLYYNITICEELLYPRLNQTTSSL